MKPIIRLKTVDSTNAYLSNLVMSEQCFQFTAVFAEYQTHGKGQGNNIWDSEPGKNLMFSLAYILPEKVKDNIFILNKYIALLIRDFIACFIPGKRVQIKWPNDILVDDKKISGILIQNICSSKDIVSIIGIGINLNQTDFQNFKTEATSLSLQSGKTFDINHLSKDIYTHLTSGLKNFKDIDFTQVQLRYKEHLYLKDVRHQFLVDGKKTTGIISDVDEHGRLVLLNENKTLSLEHGEVSYL